jgi:uncharacterized membrane protein YkvA (DUF1232 family)
MKDQRTDGKNIAQSPIFKKILIKAEEYLKHPSQVAKLLNEVFKKATAKRGMGALAGEVWENLQLLSRLIKSATTGDYKGIPTTTLVGGIAVIIYFLTPIDIIPDIIPVIGLLDDATLLAWFMTSIKSELDRFKEWEAERETSASHVPHTDTVHNADTSFGTPKYSDHTEDAVHIETKKEF